MASAPVIVSVVQARLLGSTHMTPIPWLWVGVFTRLRPRRRGSVSLGRKLEGGDDDGVVGAGPADLGPWVLGDRPQGRPAAAVVTAGSGLISARLAKTWSISCGCHGRPL